MCFFFFFLFLDPFQDNRWQSSRLMTLFGCDSFSDFPCFCNLDGFETFSLGVWQNAPLLWFGWCFSLMVRLGKYPFHRLSRLVWISTVDVDLDHLAKVAFARFLLSKLEHRPARPRPSLPLHTLEGSPCMKSTPKEQGFGLQGLRVENLHQLFGFLLHGRCILPAPPPALLLFIQYFVYVSADSWMFIYSLGYNPASFCSDGCSFGHWELCCWPLCPFSTLWCFTGKSSLTFWCCRFPPGFCCVLVIFFAPSGAVTGHMLRGLGTHDWLRLSWPVLLTCVTLVSRMKFTMNLQLTEL